jgi:hypothetical protein
MVERRIVLLIAGGHREVCYRGVAGNCTALRAAVVNQLPMKLGPHHERTAQLVATSPWRRSLTQAARQRRSASPTR